MVAGQPAPPHVDSYLLLDTVSLLRCTWGGTVSCVLVKALCSWLSPAPSFPRSPSPASAPQLQQQRLAFLLWKAVVRHRPWRSGQRPLLVPTPTAPLRSHPASVSGGPAADFYDMTRRPSSSAAFRRRLVHCTASCLARSWLDLGWVRWVRREYCPRRCINATQGINAFSNAAS